MKDDLQRQIYDKVLMKQTRNSKYLQFCRTKAYCQFRIHCLL